jgi:hypothetical protein
MEGETRLWRVRLVYGGGGLSTEGETLLQRARLFCGGIYCTRIQRGRLVYRGGDSSTEGETRLGTEICPFFTFTLFRQTCFANNFFCVHILLFQRIRNQREILRF